MSNEEPPVRRGRPPRSGGSNMGTTLGIVAAVVAVVLGFFILRDIRNDDGGSSAPGGGGTTTTAPTDSTDAPVTSPPTTIPPLVTTGFKVLVANASGVGGSAGQMTIALQGKGFIVETATNRPPSDPIRETTVVYYLSGNEAGASSVARVLGGVCIEPMPTPVPTESGSLGEASVLVSLGTDLAAKPLPAEATEVCLPTPNPPGGTTETTATETTTG